MITKDLIFNRLIDLVETYHIRRKSKDEGMLNHCKELLIKIDILEWVLECTVCDVCFGTGKQDNNSYLDCRVCKGLRVIKNGKWIQNEN